MGLWGGKQMEQLVPPAVPWPSPPSTGVLEPCRGALGERRLGVDCFQWKTSLWPVTTAQRAGPGRPHPTLTCVLAGSSRPLQTRLPGRPQVPGETW